jgi:hypothetical protein
VSVTSGLGGRPYPNSLPWKGACGRVRGKRVATVAEGRDAVKEEIGGCRVINFPSWDAINDRIPARGGEAAVKLV